MKTLRNLSTLLITVSFMGLQGCEQFSKKTVAQMCSEQPEICGDLNPDAWCRAEKADIIKHRFDHAESTDERHKYALLMHFERYQACVGKAAQIKHIKLREKETGRMKGFLTSQREILRLSEETRSSQDPYLAYYQWSRYGHDDALAVFLKAAEQGKLESAALNVAHATFLVKRDTAKAINALYTALSLYTDDEVIDPEIFNSLFTLHSQRDDLSEAIVWGLIGLEFEASTIDKDSLLRIAEQNGFSLDDLTLRADALYSRIESREFVFNE